MLKVVVLGSSLFVSRQKMVLQSLRNMLGDFALDRKYILDLAVIFLGPAGFLFRCFDKLDGNPDLVPHLPNAPFENTADVQLSANFSDGFVCSLVSHHGCPGDHPQPFYLGHRGDQFLGHTVREVLIDLIRADIGKRQDRDPVLGQHDPEQRGLDHTLPISDNADTPRSV